MTAMRSAALDLAEHGWRVHPCQPRGPKAKSPLLEHGHLDATTDPNVILAWWEKWPDAMIGAAVPDSLLVLDIDPRNGGSFDALVEVAGAIPDTLTVWSGRGDGGRHLYFMRPSGLLTSTRLPAGVDLKANGYVILPPSIHPASGKPYTWEIKPIARLTPVLRDLLRPPPALRAVVPPRGGSGAPLVRLVSQLKDGERNRGLFWAACRATESGILPEVEGDLIAAAVGAGLPEHEARQTIASALRHARTQR